MIEVIFENDATYSPLALYFIIDNEILTENGEINKLFDQVINKTKLDKEIKNLIIYKKALFNSDFTSENELLNILNPIINSQKKINNLFDIIINEIKIDREIKNLIIYKKALYNSDFGTENDLLKIN